MRHAGAILAGLLIAAPAFGQSEHTLPQRPETASRTYTQNYKDSIFVFCIAKAYASDPKISKDASATASGFDEFTRYDTENSGPENLKLVEKYLARDYHAMEGPEVKLNLMKCFDMYHSAEIEAQVRRFVIDPKRTYNQEHPPGK